MNEPDVLAWIERTGAIITDSHIVYTSGRHGDGYVNKDAVYLHAKVIRDLTAEIARRWRSESVDVVVAPAVGGVILETWVTYHLENAGRSVIGLYAEKELRSVLHPQGHGYHAFDETGRFVLNRGYDKLVAGKNVLVVEDVLTTGGSVRKVVEAVRRHGGNVVGVAALCNRGGVTAHNVGDVPRLDALVNLALESWDAESCPLCAQGVPINTQVGKGAEFLARQSR